MTLIISAYANGHCFHVSDRLLSQFRAPGRTEPLWAYANKSLVVQTVDAVVTVGFTGLAYIREMPTDRWLAGRLLTDVGDADHVGLGRATLAQLVDSLRRCLPTVLAVAPTAPGQSLLLRLEIAGLRYSRRFPGRFAPVQLSLEVFRERGLVRTRVDSHHARQALHDGRDPQIVFSFPPGRQTERWLHARLTELSPLTREDVQVVLIEALRRMADAHPTAVGRDCMLIHLLPRPGAPTYIGVEFHADPAGRSPALRLQHQDFPLAFTPALLCPGGYRPPGTGNMDIVIHPYLEMHNRAMPRQVGLPVLAYHGDLIPLRPHELRTRARRLSLPGIDWWPPGRSGPPPSGLSRPE